MHSFEIARLVNECLDRLSKLRYKQKQYSIYYINKGVLKEVTTFAERV